MIDYDDAEIYRPDDDDDRRRWWFRIIVDGDEGLWW